MKTSLNDLTVEQVIEIEQAVGAAWPWENVQSRFDLWARILSAANGEPIETYTAMKPSELLEIMGLTKGKKKEAPSGDPS